MTILLVRHGETAGNALRILQRADVPLNECGIRQSEQLAGRLFDHGFVHIVCSDLLRARMTAAPLATRSGIAIEESPLLQERNFGDLRGVPYAELTENPFGPDFAPPNGEDWPTFHARVADAFDFIMRRRRSANGMLVVVTHGLVCRALVERHALLPEGVVAPERFENASVTMLHEDAPHAVSLINCTRHLVTAYFKNAFLKQYEKFSTFLRNELCSNNLTDFRLKKGLDHLEAVRERFQTITSRFASYQAQWLNVHGDFPLLQRIALPISIGSVRYPGIKIHETRIIRLMEVLLHGGTQVAGWTAKQIHEPS